MDWKTLISNKAMDIVESYEISQGREIERVHQKGVGYDFRSVSPTEERLIEIKGVSELWTTYNWQSLHHTEVKALNENTNFFLYIVHFEMKKEERSSEYISLAPHKIFVIPRKELLTNFKITPASFALTPISRRKVEPYKVVEKSVAQSTGQNI